MNEAERTFVTEVLVTAEECFNSNLLPDEFESIADLLEKAAGLGSMAAREKLADCYLYGKGRAKDETFAFNTYKQVYESTASAYSACQLGEMYRWGQGAPKSEEQALFYLNQSWNSGYIASAGSIAEIYLLRGRTLDQPDVIEDGLRWHQRGAGKGNPYCAYRLGVFYNAGYYVPKDTRKAYHYLMKHPDYPRTMAYLVAKNGLGLCGDDQYREFVDKAKRLANQGIDFDLLRALGEAYEGKARLDGDIEISMGYFEKAIQAGDGYSAYLLGTDFYIGRGVYPRDWDRAEGYLLQSVDLGECSGMYTLGNLYRNRARNASPPDSKALRTAFEWYEKSYKNEGDKDAAYGAGEAALELGDAALEAKAAEYLTFAMEAGIVQACFPLAELSLKEGSVAFNPARAEKALEMARNEDVMEYRVGSVDNLTGLMFEKGWGLPQSLDQAVEFYTKGADKGNPFAKRALARFQKTAFGWKQIN